MISTIPSLYNPDDVTSTSGLGTTISTLQVAAEYGTGVVIGSVISASYSNTASYAANGGGGGGSGVSSSFASTSSYALSASYVATTATTTASYAVTASFAQLSKTASYVASISTASYALRSSASLIANQVSTGSSGIYLTGTAYTVNTDKSLDLRSTSGINVTASQFVTVSTTSDNAEMQISTNSRPDTVIGIYADGDGSSIAINSQGVGNSVSINGTSINLTGTTTATNLKATGSIFGSASIANRIATGSSYMAVETTLYTLSTDKLLNLVGDNGIALTVNAGDVAIVNNNATSGSYNYTGITNGGKINYQMFGGGNQIIFSTFGGSDNQIILASDRVSISGAPVAISEISATGSLFGTATQAVSASYAPTVPSGISTISASSHYSMSVSDAGKYLRINNLTNVNVYITSQSVAAWTPDTEVIIEQIGAGTVSITGSGNVVLNCAESFIPRTYEQYSVIGLKRVSQDVWTINGDRMTA